jgi:hypothetical protein
MVFTGEHRGHCLQDTFKKTINTLQRSKHLNWNAEINNTVVNYFIDKIWLLISYYDIEKTILIVTNNSKAV